MRVGEARLRATDQRQAPLRDVWTPAALPRRAPRSEGTQISLTELRRILAVEDLRPHKIRYWLHRPDPEFRPKVARICNLYLSPPPGAAVICVGENTCIQTLDPVRRIAGKLGTCQV